MVITPLPQTIQKAWGDLAVREFTEWLEVLMAERAVGPPEFDRMGEQMTAMQADLSTFGQRLGGVEKRLDGVEKRLDGVEARLTMVEHDLAEMKTDQREFRRELNERFLQFDDRLDRISGQVNERLDRIQLETTGQFDRLYDRMTSHMRWSVSLIAVFGTLVTILIALGQLGP